MANRAYLWSGDRKSPRVWERPERDYYDSRHSIPAAWFFFFRPSDIQMVDVSSHGASWQEVKLLADRKRAIELLTRRTPLLHRLIAGRLDPGTVAELLETIGRWSGPDLLMDPEQVLGSMGPAPAEDADAWHAAIFGRILAALDNEGTDTEGLLHDIGTYADLTTTDPDRYLGNVVGFTYRFGGA